VQPPNRKRAPRAAFEPVRGGEHGKETPWTRQRGALARRRTLTSAGAMPESTLGVGIIGVSPVRGWAATAHIPALRALPNYEIRALSASSEESAREAGEVFGVSAVFSGHEELVTQPDIDVVAVTVRVPYHRDLVSAALA